MLEHIYIRVVDQTKLQWQLVSNGNQQEEQAGTLSDLEKYLVNAGVSNVEASVLLPTHQCLITKVELPKKQARYLARALPFAIEDQLAEDIDNVELLPIGSLKDGHVWVVVAQKQLLEQWKTQLAQINVTVNLLTLDGLCVPHQDNPEGVDIVVHHNQVLIRNGQQCVALAYEQLNMALNHLQRDPETTKVRLIVNNGDERGNLIKAQVESQGFVDYQLVYFETSLFALLTSTLQQMHKPLNLLPQKHRVVKKKQKQPWVLPLALTACLLVLWVGTNYVQGFKINGQNQELVTVNTQLINQVLGNGHGIPDSLVIREMRKQVGQLGNKPTSSSSPLVALKDLTEAARPEKIILKELRFDKNTNQWNMTIEAKSYAQLDSVEKNLSNKGYKTLMTQEERDQLFIGKLKVTLL